MEQEKSTIKQEANFLNDNKDTLQNSNNSQLKLKETISDANFNPEIYSSAKIPRNETIYIKNINDKIREDDMKQTLRKLFEVYGEILDIKMKKSLPCRGQAFIVYKNLESSEKAKRTMSGAILYGKKIDIDFAKSKSDSLIKYQGAYSEDYFLKRKQASKLKRDNIYILLKEKRLLENSFSNENPTLINNFEHQVPKVMGFNPASLLPNSNLPNSANSNIVPSYKLFINNLSPDTEVNDLKLLFDKIPGFKEIRLIAEKNMCFIEYDNENQASQALLANNNIEVNGVSLNISYAKVLVR